MVTVSSYFRDTGPEAILIGCLLQQGQSSQESLRRGEVLCQLKLVIRWRIA